jgi:hypothetical protein
MWNRGVEDRRSRAAFFYLPSFMSDSDDQNSRHTWNVAKGFVFLLAALAQIRVLLILCPFMGLRFPGSGIESLGFADEKREKTEK